MGRFTMKCAVPSIIDYIPDMQAIDVIMATLSPAEFEGYLKGNILKYRLRAGNKGDAQKDIAKADWYSNKLIEFVGANNG